MPTRRWLTNSPGHPLPGLFLRIFVASKSNWKREIPAERGNISQRAKPAQILLPPEFSQVLLQAAGQDNRQEL